MQVELTEKELMTIINILEEKATAIKIVVRADIATGEVIEGGLEGRHRMMKEADELMNLSKQIYYSSIGKGDA